MITWNKLLEDGHIGFTVDEYFDKPTRIANPNVHKDLCVNDFMCMFPDMEVTYTEKEKHVDVLLPLPADFLEDCTKYHERTLSNRTIYWLFMDPVSDEKMELREAADYIKILLAEGD